MLAVSAAAAPLARTEFPAAEVLVLRFRRRRKLLNVTVVNILHNFGPWARLVGRRFEAAVCFRSMRNYLQTVLFYSPRARRRVACMNLLSLQERHRRPAVESFVQRFFAPQLLDYPALDGGGLPTELEANRRVVSAVLRREVTAAEVLPDLRHCTTPARPGIWLLAPFSSTKTKDYPAAKWARVLRELDPLRQEAPLVLAAAPFQREALAEFHRGLLAAGWQGPGEVAADGTLADFGRLVAGAGLVLTVDTAAAHFACALRRPAVMVCSGMHPGVYGPYAPDGRQHWVQPEPGGEQRHWVDFLHEPAVVEAARLALAAGTRSS